MKFSKTFAVVTAASTLATMAALAHGGAMGVVKDRMELMERIGDANKALTEMMRGKQEYDAGKVREQAQILAEHGGDAITELFPEGNLDAPSEALPAIWERWNDFKRLAADLTAYSEALAAAADNPRSGTADMMSGGGMMSGGEPQLDPAALADMPPDAAFMQVTQTCTACHQDFRKEQ